MTEFSFPHISVIVPTYNSENTIIRCIDSILCQRGPFTLEVIVYDDCSSDNTIELIRHTYANIDFIYIYQSSFNSGSGISRSRALSFCKGDYIAFLDSDDFWLPCKLSTQILDFHNSSKNMIISYSPYIKLSLSGPSLISPPKRLYKHNIRFINHIPMSSALFNAALLKKVKYPFLRLRNDYLFWSLLLSLSPDYFAQRVSPQPLFVYGSVSGISSHKFSLLYKQYSFYRAHFNYSHFLAFYGVILNVFRRLFP
jgi:teichuronic acid biosynthesis glycosyltransferase TuaG